MYKPDKKKKAIKRILLFCFPLFRNIFPYQLYTFLVLGTLNTSLNIGLFAFFYLLLSPHFLDVEIATVLSFGITLMSGFWLNRNITFERNAHRQQKISQFNKYALVAIQGQFSDYLITKGLIVLLAVNPLWAYLISTFIMLAINYFLQKYYTFRATSKLSA